MPAQIFPSPNTPKGPSPAAAKAAGAPDQSGAFVQWLKGNSSEIIEQWLDRISALSVRYRHRLTSELYYTVSEAFRANLEALDSGSRDRIDNFIDYITEKRLQAGFPLSDVQKAFELFRSIVVSMLLDQGEHQVLSQGMKPLNDCLAYTIHKFSDHFQLLHEAEIRKHADMLEKKVRLRTAELAESERKYKTLINEINDGYFIVQDQRVAFANEAFCRMHGAPWEEVVGKRFLSFVVPEYHGQVMAAFRKALLQRSPGGQLEYPRTGCPPEQAATEVKYRGVDLGQGMVTIGVCRDISARVAMEAKIREHERMAYIGHIAASLSHEIRNPLSTCTLNMLILRDKLNLDGFDRRRLEITVRELTRLEEILRQLLDMSRPLSLNPAPVALSDVAGDCLDLLRGKISEKGITLRQRYCPELPLVQADYDMMVQAFLNLMLNAVEAVEPGGRIVTWTKSRDTEAGPRVYLGVHDNGPGISPKDMPNLFTPFYTNKSRGTGLGLSNVKRIVEAHGGEVAVKSLVGSGATFIMRMPCR